MLTTSSPTSVHADDVQNALFSGGDARLLQPAFEEMRYLGVKSVEVGHVDLDELSTLRIGYDSLRVTYKQLLGKYWRNVDLTDEGGQFQSRGAKYRPTVWVGTSEEMSAAAQSMAKMEQIGVYGKNKASGTKILDEAKAGVFTPEMDNQDFYLKKPKEFEQLAANRVKFFAEKYRPIKTTACEGSVCGYVYFPCSEENGCLQIVNGKF
jgi:peptide-methionine (S)-S-oxide reductase